MTGSEMQLDALATLKGDMSEVDEPDYLSYGNEVGLTFFQVVCYGYAERGT